MACLTSGGRGYFFLVKGAVGGGVPSSPGGVSVVTPLNIYAWEGGGCQTFSFCSLFPVQQTPERDWPPCEEVTLNVTNRNETKCIHG